ncbi:MAG: winged helix-turn-helix domain-containing protein [bacterium]
MPQTPEHSFCIWIIGSDTALAQRWEAVLRSRGWMTSHVSSIAHAESQADRCAFGIMIIEEPAVNESGGKWLEHAATSRKNISFILFGGPGGISDKRVAECLEKGFDDHIPRDIDVGVLVAKLRAHIRRVLPSLALTMEEFESRSGRIRISRSRRMVWIINSKGVLSEVRGLTPTEFELMILLVEHAGSIVERRKILERIWKNREVNAETVDKHVEALRKKLGSHGSDIQTMYGQGYIFNEEL